MPNVLPSASSKLTMARLGARPSRRSAASMPPPRQSAAQSYPTVRAKTVDPVAVSGSFTCGAKVEARAGYSSGVVENRAASRDSSPNEEDMKDMIALIAGAGIARTNSAANSERR